jgi:hypothetical protein
MVLIHFQAFDAGRAPFFFILIVLILVFVVPAILLYKLTIKPPKGESGLNLSQPNAPKDKVNESHSAQD